MRRGRVLASGDQALPALVQARAPGAPVPALAVRPVVAHSSAPRAPSRDLRPTDGAPAATVLLPADPLTSPPVLAPVPRPAARFLGVPDAPAPVPPLLADAPAPSAAVLPPSPRLAAELQGAALVLSRGLLLIADAPAPAPPLLVGAPAADVAVLRPIARHRVRFVFALVAFARGFPSIGDPSPPDIPLTADAPETPAPILLSAFAALHAAFLIGRVGRAATRTGPCQEPPTSSKSEGCRLQ